MRIDAHAHVIVPEVLRDAAPREAWRPRVWWQDGAQVVELGGREIRSAVREFVDVDAILAAQDDARPADTAAAAGLEPQAERLVVGGNAARILGLEVRR